MARGLGSSTLAVLVLIALPTLAQDFNSRFPPRSMPAPAAQPPQQAYPQARSAPQPPPGPRMAATPNGPNTQPPANLGQPEHPVLPILRWAEGAHKNLQGVQDYSATFVKRDRIDGVLGEQQTLFLKVRQKPFSVYLYFLGPEAVKGREAIYVEGKNDGHLLAHATGIKDTLVGTLKLKPDSAMAMQGTRHPITDIGLSNLCRKTIDSCHRGTQYSDIDVRFIPGVKLSGRPCTCIHTTHKSPRRDYPFHMVRLFVDDELSLPIRYEAYEWPKRAGEEPPVAEEYTYLNLKFNNGFTDTDFDPKNPNYRFR